MKQMRHRSPHAILALFVGIAAAGGLAACDQGEVEENGTNVVAPVDTTPEPAAPIAGSCQYKNAFSKTDECLDYNGSGWTEATAATECKGIQYSKFTAGKACDYPSVLARCLLDAGTADETRIVFPGDDVTQCSTFQLGCEVFAKGKFEPVLCEGVVVENPDPPTTSVFEWPTLSCVEPIEGEPAGQSNGQVCTWNSISGCTEPGRRYADYGSCETVINQRPYWSAGPSDFKTPDNDPLHTDAVYQQELSWVAEQMDACACVCCHSTKAAPAEGPSNWFIEAPGIWTDSFYPTGLAMAAGWIESWAFGAFPAHQNNGFSRDQTGIPTTDPDRMRAFFEGELTRRGFKKDDFASAPPFGGPLYDQAIYVPSACEAGQGVDATGKVNWTGGGARYVYVLAKDAKNPGAPPNLDLPANTIWRIDVASTQEPVKTGITYGEIPANAKQIFPTDGKAASLVSGETYLIYVLADVAVPVTRCLFTYP